MTYQFRCPTKPPQVMLAGMPRCGSTSLFYAMASFPVELFPIKEPHFFCGPPEEEPELPPSLYERWLNDPSDYAERWPGSGGLRVEASPWVLISKDAVARVLQCEPHARFVVTLREPGERFLSHVLALEGGPDTPAVEILAALQTGDPGARFPFATTASQYSRHLERLVEAAGRDRVLVLNYSWLEDRPAHLLAEVGAFLDLDVAPRDAPPRYNSSGNVRSRTLSRVLDSRRLSSTDLKRRLPASVVNLGGRVIHRMRSLNRRRINLPDDVVDAARAHFSEERAYAFERFGLDL